MIHYFRAHRGTLEASMNTVVEITTIDDLLIHLKDETGIRDIIIEDILIKPYGYDERIGWNTMVVILKPAQAVVGFLDGPL